MDYQTSIFPPVFAQLLDDLHSGHVERYLSAIDMLKAFDMDVIEAEIYQVRNLLSHSDPIVRSLAIELLLTIDLNKTLEWVLPLLEDKNPKVRKRLLIDLIENECRNTIVVAPLIKVLQFDNNPNARAKAAFLLGCIGGEQAVPALIEAQINDQETDYEGVPVGIRAGQALIRLSRR